MTVNLNLHAANGVWLHEEQYPEMGRRMGVSASSPVRFDCSKPAFMHSYFEML
jgi:hypothetical protein